MVAIIAPSHRRPSLLLLLIVASNRCNECVVGGPARASDSFLYVDIGCGSRPALEWERKADSSFFLFKLPKPATARTDKTRLTRPTCTIKQTTILLFYFFLKNAVILLIPLTLTLASFFCWTVSGGAGLAGCGIIMVVDG